MTGQAPADRLLSWSRVRDMVGISRTTAWRLQRTGGFPAPVQVSPGRVAWRESELAAWFEARRPFGGAVGEASSPRFTPPRVPRLPGIVKPPQLAEVSSSPKPQGQGRASGPVSPTASDLFDRGLRSRTLKTPRKRRAPALSNQIDFGF